MVRPRWGWWSGAWLLLALCALGACAATTRRRPLRIVPREAWDTSTAPAAWFTEQRVRRIIIHHDGVDYRAGQSGEEKLRALLRGVRARDRWPDVPYHYLVDRDGRIFTGRPERYAGDTHANYDCRDALHIALLGNYERLEPDPAQIDAILDLVALKASQYGLPASAIAMHCDLIATKCPGANARRRLGQVDWTRLVAP